MTTHSPLRYPGGKGSLSGQLASLIETNNLTGCSYFEPFAGGAGAALQLLSEGVVAELLLNDLDPRIFAFWKAVLTEHERFAETIMLVELNIDQWHRQKDICLQPSLHSTFDLGFATFYLNRCNRSGVLLGSAPIGGYSQTGEWRMDARFYRQTLADRVVRVAKQRDRIRVTNVDAQQFLTAYLPKGGRRKEAFVYVDPPYVSKGSRLYLNDYDTRHHRDLSRYLRRQQTVRWVASYDDTELIRGFYADCNIGEIQLQYSLQNKRKASELMITPPYVKLPSEFAANCRDEVQANLDTGQSP